MINMLVFKGTIIHSTWEQDVVIRENMVLGVHDTKIIFVFTVDQLDELKGQYGFKDNQITTLTRGEFLMPGLIDTHIHTAQYVNAGKGLDLQLLDWIEKYTIPIEEKFADLDQAQKVSEKLVRRLLRNGTTTACYLTMSRLESSLVLCNVIKDHGQRAFVGISSVNQIPSKILAKTTDECVRNTKRFIEEVRNINSDLVKPAVNAPHALGCDRELLSRLVVMAQEFDTPIQSHLSENKAANEKMLQLHPYASSVTDIYRQTGMLNKRTCFGHAIHLPDEELEILQESEAAVSHCPNSNISLCSGLCDVRRLVEHGIPVGLGTDVSAGYQCSMLDAIRLTTHTSNILSLNKGTDYKRVDYKEAFKLATLGGSKAIGMETRIGNFEVGKEFDAVRVNALAPDSPIDVFYEDTIEDIFQKFIYLGDDRNIGDVYVAGQITSKTHVDAKADNGL